MLQLKSLSLGGSPNVHRAAAPATVPSDSGDEAGTESYYSEDDAYLFYIKLDLLSVI